MKIIASISDGLFLVEATAYELAKVQGESYPISLKEHPRVGHDIKINLAWEHLQRFRAAKSELEVACRTLCAVANLADNASAVYAENPIPEECLE